MTAPDAAFAAVYAVAAAGWLVAVRRHVRRRRHEASFLAGHQRVIRHNQTAREVDESAPIVWRS